MDESTSDQKTLLKSKNVVFRLLKIRQRSEKEIRDRLKFKKTPKNIIEKTVYYFKNLRFIDDRQFAKDWINARLSKPFGLNRIRLELRQKGIEDTIIEEELALKKENYLEETIVSELVQRRFSRYKNLDKLKTKRRLFEYLIRRGFRIETINKVLRKIDKTTIQYDDSQ